MNILSIGNSFSQDAQRYLHRIARADKVELNTFNLYIGGCPLSLHYQNMLSEERRYTLEMNGSSTGFYVSLKEGLLNREWDVVTIQQVSTQSPYYDTYQPYLEKIVEYIRLLAPKAKIAVHQTWAYEQGSHGLNVQMGYSDHKQMLRHIMHAYQTAAEHVGADYVIPAGEVLGALQEAGVGKVHSDTKHASRGFGRYALGLVWYRFLTGNDIAQNAFCDFDEEVTAEQIAVAKKCVLEIADKYKM